MASDAASDRAPEPPSGRAEQEASLLDENRDRARQRIVRAAQKALAVRGLATTVDEVAAVAGVSRRTVFRHFATRERLVAAAIRAGLRSYAEHVPPFPGAEDGSGPNAGPAGPASEAVVSDWLLDVMLAAHRLNARNGRVYWDLSALDADLPGELAAAGAERREARRRFAVRVTRTLWRARRGPGEPPAWLTDTVAVHLSGFTLQSLAGDFGRSPEDVARVSARVVEASLAAALAGR